MDIVPNLRGAGQRYEMERLLRGDPMGTFQIGEFDRRGLITWGQDGAGDKTEDAGAGVGYYGGADLFDLRRRTVKMGIVGLSPRSRLESGRGSWDGFPDPR